MCPRFCLIMLFVGVVVSGVASAYDSAYERDCCASEYVFVSVVVFDVVVVADSDSE